MTTPDASHNKNVQYPGELVVAAKDIATIAHRIEASGQFAMDLEFMSADRYVPDLALIQLAWQEEGELQIVLVDGVDTELTPILKLIESEQVLLIAHAATQDLSLLASRYQVRAGAFVDTQIAAAFAGIAEQIGYANLVKNLLSHRLDKGSQFTDWMRRPLSAKQLRYAADDVRYLGAIWKKMKTDLQSKQRLSWVQEESAALVHKVGTRPPSEELYKNIGGGSSLKGASLGAFRALIAWRNDLALAENTPPSWILTDSCAVEVCRRNTNSVNDLKRIRGIGTGTASKYGDAILEVVSRGRQSPVATANMPMSLSPTRQAQAAVVTAIVAGKAAEIGIPARTIAAKADAEALVRYMLSSKSKESTDLPKLLSGWRAQAIGEDALAWLRGTATLISDDVLGVRIQRA